MEQNRTGQVGLRLSWDVATRANADQDSEPGRVVGSQQKIDVLQFDWMTIMPCPTKHRLLPCDWITAERKVADGDVGSDTSSCISRGTTRGTTRGEVEGKVEGWGQREERGCTQTKGRWEESLRCP